MNFRYPEKSCHLSTCSDAISQLSKTEHWPKIFFFFLNVETGIFTSKWQSGGSCKEQI